VNARDAVAIEKEPWVEGMAPRQRWTRISAKVAEIETNSVKIGCCPQDAGGEPSSLLTFVICYLPFF
jgi:hypothetical protein